MFGLIIYIILFLFTFVNTILFMRKLGTKIFEEELMAYVFMATLLVSTDISFLIIIILRITELF